MSSIPNIKTQLKSLYPTLFESRDFGFSVGDGWHGILHNFCSDIYTLIQDETNLRFSFLQVKEKFGILNIYWNLTGESPNTEYIRQKIAQLVSDATILSSKTCEISGKEGRLYKIKTINGIEGYGWWRTLSPEIAQQMEYIS